MCQSVSLHELCCNAAKLSSIKASERKMHQLPVILGRMPAIYPKNIRTKNNAQLDSHGVHKK